MAVKYTPVSAVDTIVQPGQRPKRLYVVRFTDARKKKDVVGQNNNAFNLKVNDVRTSDDVGLIVAEAVTDALRKGGHLADLNSDRATGVDVPASELRNYDAVVGGEITLLDVTSKPAWNTVDATARVAIRLHVQRGGKTEWVGPIEGTAKQGTVGQDITNAMSQALDGAIQNCMRALARHLKAGGALG